MKGQNVCGIYHAKAAGLFVYLMNDGSRQIARCDGQEVTDTDLWLARAMQMVEFRFVSMQES